MPDFCSGAGSPQKRKKYVDSPRKVHNYQTQKREVKDGTIKKERKKKVGFGSGKRGCVRLTSSSQCSAWVSTHRSCGGSAAVVNSTTTIYHRGRNSNMQQHSPGSSGTTHLRPPGSPRTIAKSMKSSLAPANGSPLRSSLKKSEKSPLLSQPNNHSGVAITTTSAATTHTSSSHSHSGSGIRAIFFLPIGVFMFVIWNMVQVLQTLS